MYLESRGEFHDEFTLATTASVSVYGWTPTQAEILESVFNLANQIYVFLLATFYSLQVSWLHPHIWW